LHIVERVTLVLVKLIQSVPLLFKLLERFLLLIDRQTLDDYSDY
jgi:hypothetical protein